VQRVRAAFKPHLRLASIDSDFHIVRALQPADPSLLTKRTINDWVKSSFCRG